MAITMYSGFTFKTLGPSFRELEDSYLANQEKVVAQIREAEGFGPEISDEKIDSELFDLFDTDGPGPFMIRRE